MKKAIFLILIFIFLTACKPASREVTAEVVFADTILTNGRVYTQNPEQPWAEAVAIRDGKFIFVGSSPDVVKHRGESTTVIDLGGDTVMPGLHDQHVHPVFGGIRENDCKIPQGSTLQEIQTSIVACVEDTGPGEWVFGGQWDASAVGQVPTREMLDVVSPDNPVLLEDTSGHSAWANSKALELADLSKDTTNPVAGIIERDIDGIPTGVLREEAVMLVRKYVPVPTDEDVRSALEWSLNKMLSYGITSFTEASLGFTAGTERELNAYVALADAGVLKQRTRICMPWQDEELIASRDMYARDRVKPDCVKIFNDGVPTDSHTAAMLEPYEGTVEGRDDEASRTGMLLVDQDTLDQAVIRFDQMGLTVKFHAAGDAAVRAGLNAIEAARKANGLSKQLHNVGHCTFVDPQDIARASAIAATFEVSPYLWAPSPINDDITAAVGSERIRRVWPVREMIESGALVVPGSDWSVVPSVNPWIGLETLVTRQVPGSNSEKTFGGAQAIPLDQAVDMYTVNSAKHMGQESILGRIETGMLADIIVLDQNPFEVPVSWVHMTQVKMTFIDGEKVFDNGTVPLAR